MSDVSSIGNAALRLLAEATARSTLLALLVGLALAACRVRSVTARHAAWAAVLCAMLGLPALTGVLPGLALPILSAVADRAVIEQPRDVTSTVPPDPGQPDRGAG